MGAAAIGPVGRYLSRQAARPHGVVGRLLGRIWVNESAAVNDVAVELLGPAPGERICEIGFGPGRTLGRLAAAGAQVIGVEVSTIMEEAAARRNADLIAAGRLSLHRGDGIHLPLPDDSLDAVLAVHNIYFWPDPAATLAEIARTLQPGGSLVLAFPAGEHPLPARFDPAIYRLPTTTEATHWLQSAGFVDIDVERRPHISAAVVWIIATAP
ncbi:class I SAM-dependent methyltransferase [Jiangella alkaliphila]|nr:class I SAM-dependent methyltransferase [Jiangella alkaliphila]